jgi:hypothetical protein
VSVVLLQVLTSWYSSVRSLCQMYGQAAMHRRAGRTACMVSTLSTLFLGVPDTMLAWFIEPRHTSAEQTSAQPYACSIFSKHTSVSHPTAQETAILGLPHGRQQSS